ncbi:hypothetical protein [Hymenobacter persicinus]|uniref:Uncharacterized protein n=1 Tax=Hymenobacter persicinus TaxID=2025506 RepID=A0A4Q5LI05_9BACT|nr:hypothetical protein [Hymenobacter persicinus]RYU84298.1 hypothetical protein EWM57_00980 [Hymenobacter persicinus]
MENLRKAAYRGILYNFLVGIRCAPVALTDAEEARAIRIGRHAGPVAYLLHNLALASVQDFVGFDEDAFWRSVEAFNNRNPSIAVPHFRKQFEADLFAH